MVFPSPPVLKTTIIQLNKELDSDDKNYEILTNEYTNNSTNNSVDIINSGSGSSSLSNNKKKRRRSSANIDSEELAKRKHETKQLHSIIEKRRRIKINREFEALKYLIPACRASNANQPTATAKKNQPNPGNANGNKIDGMYKLTILKSSVEYILYLHHIIQKQHELLQQSNNEAYSKFNIDFAKIPLDVNQYRNIDKEFNFKELLEGTSPSTSSSEMSSSGRSFDYRTHSIVEEQEEDDEGNTSSTSTATINGPTTTNTPTNYQSTIPMSASSSISELKKPQLPSPEFTPDIAPILTMLNKYQTASSASQSPNLISRKSSYASPNMLGIKSNNPSPFTIPMKSTLSGSAFTSPSMIGSSSSSAKANGFRLPEPAVEVDQQLVPPRKMYFKSKSNASFAKEDSYEDKDQDASKTLLALRKSSIDSLLN
ncbi:uncharacterized protein SPAPADRAFT_62383 [Spathaspora passalidarum NRRL Y-27907]|uniref:BHLH domain-containing protein n=1 Tax=Spathaspora passalidarum (strain NRRL Y-27907 / 11-Y1) TaxID=619300 RepID=G3ARN5_SPAPN|nr:uncharacterized protein SPAPADRAFT_62383 [Spathaspora passalidarum NRRL Y-27907]EGW31788.1 hypothetical protein SPAPADRAFT_62383 [Spathaspora passalidarum NRRL Y-27907]